MTDLRKLFFETPAKISDREAHATARLNTRVREFLGKELDEGTIERINQAVADESDKLIADGILTRRPDWLAVLFRRRLHVAFGSSAVQQLSRELREKGALQ